MIYRYKEKYSVLVMCRFFAVSRSGYYSFVKRMANFYLPLPPTHILGGDFEGNDAERLAEAVLNLRPRPTAVITAADMRRIALSCRVLYQGGTSRRRVTQRAPILAERCGPSH